CWAEKSDRTGDGQVSDDMANPVSPTVNRRTTLKDALSMMLDADVQTGVVVDRTGAVQGLLTVGAIATQRQKAEHTAVFDQAADDPGEPATEAVPADDEPEPVEASG